MQKLGLIFTFVAVLSRGLSAAPTEDGLYAHFVTNHGEFYCRLEFEKARRTVANFVSLAEGTRNWVDIANANIVDRPFYDGLTFHRVDDGFVIQGGSPNGNGTDGPGYQFNDEFHLELRHNQAGILSMANSGLNTNGSQFFVTLAPTPWLDDVHSVFGEVVEGMEIVNAIAKVEVDANDRPLEPVIMQSVEILRIGEVASAFDPNAVEPPLPSVNLIDLNISRVDDVYSLLWEARAERKNLLLLSGGLENWNHNFYDPFASGENATFPVINNLVNQYSHVFFRMVEYDRE